MLELAGVLPGAAAPQAQAIMTIETELAKASLDRVARRDPEKLYHKKTLKELDDLGSGIAWAKFFRAVGAPRFQALNVDVPEFIQAVNMAVASHSLEDLKAYLTWNLVRESANALALPFEQESFNFYGKTLRGAKEMRPRWKRCVDLTDQQLPDALGRKFVETTLGAEGMRRTHEMVGEIEKAMAADLQSLDWMTPQTKQQAGSSCGVSSTRSAPTTSGRPIPVSRLPATITMATLPAPAVLKSSACSTASASPSTRRYGT